MQSVANAIFFMHGSGFFVKKQKTAQGLFLAADVVY
jgi:hypothetical protein